MAVIRISETYEGREGGTSLNGTKSVRKHTRVFRAWTNSQYDTDWEVCAALPPIGAVHPKDPYAFLCDKKAVNESNSKFLWRATLQYTTERQRAENPLMDPATFEWDTDTTQVPFYWDKDGYPILNTAGDYFVEPIKDEVSLWTVTVTKNLPWVPGWIGAYRDAVNSDSFLLDGIVVPVGCAKIKKIRISKIQTRNDYQYRELQLTVKLQDDWKKTILSTGLFQLVPDPMGGDPFRLPCTDDAGHPVHHPVLLDENGAQVPTGTSPLTLTPMTIDLRKTLPFSALPLY